MEEGGNGPSVCRLWSWFPPFCCVSQYLQEATEAKTPQAAWMEYSENCLYGATQLQGFEVFPSLISLLPTLTENVLAAQISFISKQSAVLATAKINSTQRVWPLLLTPELCPENAYWPWEPGSCNNVSLRLLEQALETLMLPTPSMKDWEWNPENSNCHGHPPPHPHPHSTSRCAEAQGCIQGSLVLTGILGCGVNMDGWKGNHTG